MTDKVDFKDFGRKRKTIAFSIGEDNVFSCVPALSLPAMQEIAGLAQDFTVETAVDHFVDFFNLVLVPESAAKFEDKMRNDRLDPIDQEQALDIMLWVLEQYGVRPTQPSSDSSDGSQTGDGGTPSEAGASEVAE